ncbi:1-phosphofructokinase [Sporosarcina jiandibaonis]|uniref:1-phosphofructokinase n=1 Tax=Sporosarcina jiandibaonis TaxID=2715535 RepID=UPI0015552707|nr:1-phosphofructokinase [Sporosarcina jiandibaonis]
MIYTCTITPSLDYTTYLPELRLGELNRSSEVFYYPGGKGINVSRVLGRLGTSSVALGYIGGFTGQYITDFLNKEGILTDFIQTDEITRINVKVKAAEESELNGPGPRINYLQQNELLEKVKAMTSGDWFVLAGSLTRSIPISFFKELAAICEKNNVKFVLDTSGSALKDLIHTKPFLIKPNIEELGELFHTEITTKEEALHFAKNLVGKGIQHVVVSMGGEGALLVTEDLTLFAEAPKGQVVNTVGAGDSLVAGFLASFTKNEDASEAFRYGVASGSATAFSSDLCVKNDVDRLHEQLTIQSLTEGNEK